MPHPQTLFIARCARLKTNLGLSTSLRTFRRLAAFSGIAGQLALGAYYSGAVVPAALLRGVSPTSVLVTLAADHRRAIVLDAWLQCTGALLTVILFLALVDLAGARRRFAGRMTAVVAAAMLAVAIADATFAIVAANAAALGHQETVQVAFDLVAGPAEAFDYAFLFVPAPALILSLGAVLMNSTVLPRVFAWSAVAVGLAFLVVGKRPGMTCRSMHLSAPCAPVTG